MSSGASAIVRQVAKGLFEYKSNVYLITATEQVGHIGDPAAFRALHIWPLDDNANFSLACVWMPKKLVEEVQLGETN